MPTQHKQPERYDPMPGFLEMPGWLWRKMPPVAKGALVLSFVGLIWAIIELGCMRGTDGPNRFGPEP